MKKLVSLLLTVICWQNVAFAQTTPGDPIKLPRIDDAQVPAAIVAKFEADHPNHTGVVKWYQRTPTLYAVTFQEGGRKTADYLVIPPATCSGVQISPTPQPIINFLNDRFGAGAFTIVCTSQLPDGTVETHVLSGGNTYSVVCDSRFSSFSITLL